MGTLRSMRLYSVLLSLGLFTLACQNDLESKPIVKRNALANGKTEPSSPIPNQSTIDSADAAGDKASSDSIIATPAPTPVGPEIKDPVVLPVLDTKSEGCSTATELAEGEINFKVDNLARKYVVRKPKAYSKDKAWPLVLALHPNGSNTSYWDGTSGDRAIRKLFGDKAIIIVAQARAGDWRGDLPTELAYFDAMLSRAKKELCIDNKKIFSMGFSGGGSFSGVLGCSRTDIRAIASGGAVAYFDPKTCVGSPAAWITIGDDEAEKARLDFRDFWRDYNKCSSQTKVLTPASCVEYSCPDLARPTQFCSHPGGHEWPSFGSQNAWDFFSKF